MTTEGFAQLKRHEGLRLKAYKCPAGVWTIGYGHTGGVNYLDEITEERAEELLIQDVQKAEYGARNLIVDFDELTPRRQDACINLVFNLGENGLKKFTTFLRMMKLKLWPQAAAALISSKWHRQVGRRSYEIEKMIRNG